MAIGKQKMLIKKRYKNKLSIFFCLDALSRNAPLKKCVFDLNFHTDAYFDDSIQKTSVENNFVIIRKT